jgi:hypothetical protein
MGETKINYSQGNQYYMAPSSTKTAGQVSQSEAEILKQNKTLEDFASLVSQKKEEVKERIKNGEEETSFQIGGTSMTQTEWKSLIGKVDHAVEQIKEEQEIKQQQQVKEKLETDTKKEVKEEQEILEKQDEKKEEEQELKEEQEVTENMVLELLKDRDDKEEIA